jgi:hypothetical protein
MKRDLTKEEEALIEVYYQKHLAMMTDQHTLEAVTPTINTMWEKLGAKKNPEIVLCDSPIACKKASKGKDGLYVYWSLWLSSYAALYDYSDKIGIELDQEKLKECLAWSAHCPYILFNDDIVYVSNRPNKVEYNDDRQLHCEDGMACSFNDGWGVYAIDGVHLDKQIVMEPETQTISEIRNESNEEVKRIRIERFGTGKFLKGIAAKIIDQRDNAIEATKEYLLSTDMDMNYLMCHCPSTAKDFYLEVPPETKTCSDAQNWLSSGLSSRTIGAS